MTYVNPTFVYARGSIYLFGLGEGKTVCARYSFGDKKSYYYEIHDIAGDSYVSACFDGSRNIYLLGGSIDHKLFNRVDCFDITTKKTRLVTNLVNIRNYPPPHTYYHNNLVYIVGAKTNFTMARSLVSFDVVNHVTTVEHILPEITGRIMSCFDGQDRIFFKEKETIITYSLANKDAGKYASKCPVDGHLVYDPATDGILILGGMSKNFRHSIKDDIWTQIVDNDKTVDRLKNSGCLVRG
ncbi:hypothetical protein SAMD00019534_063610 [Acytostelium subglobosum LB1]|uniref:hypothetical protein n=1 Tax=Acytostelium subglobosum LB1 TaxID=1410327 RepID=UPI000644B119|nr:hypothetical protein SAMD00019534_063610 [Acytostelium subglobosum LB1]GAM23186.1 hypothetical protein SAMD00019534_063610 [Acytostelium subglobosum LB1]|eukprot:XP_012753635.1 hypothetical protein SAMD00019534_063610 [Acytostelium subglobosum LB1]